MGSFIGHAGYFYSKYRAVEIILSHIVPYLLSWNSLKNLGDFHLKMVAVLSMRRTQNLF